MMIKVYFSFILHVSCRTAAALLHASSLFKHPGSGISPDLGHFIFMAEGKKKQWFLKLLLRHREYCPAAYIPLAKAIHMAKAAASEVGIYSCHGGGGPVEGEVL